MFRLLACLCGLVLMTGLVIAQSDTVVLSLNAVSTNLQTGQFYDIAIRVDGAPDFWLADVEISYDPAMLYIMGTSSGSPVILGEAFSGAGAVTARNAVEDGELHFTVSKAGDVPPAPGTGIIGSFRIYPLASGTTRLTFSRADIRQLNAARDGTDAVSFTPVLLELTIGGNPVEPPSEATATPAPTATSDVAGGVSQPTRAVQPTLLNVTAAVPMTVPQVIESQPPLLPIAIAVMVIGAIGFIIVLILWMRSKRN